MKGTLFHICNNVKIDTERVIWHDMLLDIWVSRDLSVSVLDEDELNQCLKEGKISSYEADYIEKTKNDILHNLHRILRQAPLWEKHFSHTPDLFNL